MASAYACIYLTDLFVDDFECLINLASEDRIKASMGDQMTALAEDGAARVITAEAVVQRIRTHGDVSFLLWLSSSEEMICSVFFDRCDAVVVECRMDGLRDGELERATRMAWRFFSHLIERRLALAYVLDTSGYLEDVPWDDVVLERDIEYLCDLAPDVIAVPIDHQLKMTDTLSGVIVNIHDGFLVYCIGGRRWTDRKRNLQ